MINNKIIWAEFVRSDNKRKILINIENIQAMEERHNATILYVGDNHEITVEGGLQATTDTIAQMY